VLQRLDFYLVDNAGTEHRLDGTNSVNLNGIMIPSDRLLDQYSYRVKWYVASYDANTQMGMAIFNCGATASFTGTTCGEEFSTNFKAINAGTGTVLTAAQSTALSLPTYNFGGVNASNLEFVQDVSLATAALTQRHSFVYRFYQRGAIDTSTGSSFISMMLPGGLSILNLGTNAYLGTYGRQLVLPVDPCGSYCPAEPDEQT